MTIECYFSKCEFHKSHESKNYGHVCTLDKCVATEAQIKEFMKLPPRMCKTYEELLSRTTSKKPRTFGHG